MLRPILVRRLALCSALGLAIASVAYLLNTRAPAADAPAVEAAPKVVAGGATVIGVRAIAGPSEQVHLLELFSSEGCSSCPPAEAWLGSLKADPRLWTAVVPLAWYVTYWDNIGWKDPWADDAYTQRQYSYADAWKASNVYTPAYVLDGAEWRNRRGGLPAADAERPQAGPLRLEFGDAGTLAATWMPTAKVPGLLELHVALLGSNLSSQVTSGENDGRTLKQEFVVMKHLSTPLARKGERHLATTSLPSMPGPHQPSAIAAWVTRPGELTPLQAVGGWLAAPAAK